MHISRDEFQLSHNKYEKCAQNFIYAPTRIAAHNAPIVSKLAPFKMRDVRLPPPGQSDLHSVVMLRIVH